MKSVSLAKLEGKFGKADGLDRFKQIAELGGFGEVDGISSEGSLDRDADLDLAGVLDPDNKAVSESAKSKIKELAGEEKEAKAEKAEKK